MSTQSEKIDIPQRRRPVARPLSPTTRVGFSSLKNLHKAKLNLSADGILKHDGHAYFAILEKGILSCYLQSELPEDFNPRTGPPSSDATFSIDVTSIQGMEQSDDRQQFSLLTNDVAPRTFQCATVSDARYWLFCVQRSILHKAKAAKIPGTTNARVLSRRHTLGNFKGFQGVATTNVYCGSFFEAYSALETGRRRTMEDACHLIHDLNAEMKLDTGLYPPQAFFALYDGHAGYGAVEFCLNHMAKMLVSLSATTSEHGGDAAAAAAAADAMETSECSRSLSASNEAPTPARLGSTNSSSSVGSLSSSTGSSNAAAPSLRSSEPTSPRAPLLLSAPALALKAAFEMCDASFRKLAVAQRDFSGTTALVALLRAHRLYIANAGDCRAVLCRDGTAVDLSTDHKPTPNQADEVARVEEAGGWIQSREVLNVPRLYALGLEDDEIDEDVEELVGWVTVHRVNGCLGVTRSIGDVLIKDLRHEQFEDVEFVDNKELVIAEPEITSTEIVPGDDFVVIASDGLWDVFTSQEAVDFVRKEDQGSRASRQYLSTQLMNEAMRRGSIDNISALVLFFKHDSGFNETTLQGELGLYRTAKRQFSKRFGVFAPAERTLLLYKSRRHMLAGKSPDEVLSLRNVKACLEIVHPSESRPGAEDTGYAFQLHYGSAVSVFCCRSDEERSQWVSCLTRSIAH